MVKFTSRQAQAAAELGELVNRFSYELDFNQGLGISSLLTEDCRYQVMGAELRGRAAVHKLYNDLARDNGASVAGVPTARHLNANLCIDFAANDSASLSFNLLYFTTAGTGSTQPDAIAVADVRMDCLKENDGHWLIARFESDQPFIRT